MKKWKILFNIIMETVIFFGIAVLLIIGIPKLMGFFWPFVASWILALLATPLCNFLEKHIKLNKKWSSAVIIVLVLLALAGIGYLAVTKLGRDYFQERQNTMFMCRERLSLLEIALPILFRRFLLILESRYRDSLQIF